MRANARARERIAGVLAALPPVEHALAYGSAVLADASVAGPERALDVLVAVRDPAAWHDANATRNPSHYAWHARLGGGRAIHGAATTLGADAHYNARLRDERGRAYKYGVVDVRDVVDDLERWKHLFVAERMHKPHETARACAAIVNAQARNARSAANAALLTLPETFSELDFHRAIVRLSYDGDVRFAFAAEDGLKIERIARSNGEAMREMYEDVVRELKGVETSASTWRQDKSPEATRERIDALPATVTTMLNRVEVGDDAERVGDAVRACLRRIVRASTLRQAVAGLLTTSPMKTLAYVGAKFFKAASSRATNSSNDAR